LLWILGVLIPKLIGRPFYHFTTRITRINIFFLKM
jgi:hypothetical protein